MEAEVLHKRGSSTLGWFEIAYMNIPSPWVRPTLGTPAPEYRYNATSATEIRTASMSHYIGLFALLT